MRRAWYIVGMGGAGVYTGFGCEREHLEDPGIDAGFGRKSIYIAVRSHLLHAVNQGAGKFSLATQTYPFKPAAAC